MMAMEGRMIERFRAQTLTLAVTTVTSVVGGMAIAAGIARF
jgi:hypothetical protein